MKRGFWWSKDLNIIQIVPDKELKCGVIANNIEDIKMDYRYGLEKGMDSLNDLKKLSNNRSLT